MNGQPDLMQRTVKLEGFTPIMFDRYAGDNTTQLPAEQKMYFLGDGKTLAIPAANISSFLSAKNTDSVAKLIGGRSYKKLASALLGFLIIEPTLIPLCRNSEPIVFSGFTDGRDERAQISVDFRVARLDKGIPNPKERPILDLPWEVEFKLTIIRNDIFNEDLLKDGFRRGGLMYGLGTYRGVFGKFLVAKWE